MTQQELDGLREELRQLHPEADIKVGYIGNVDSNGKNDNRSWRVWCDAIMIENSCWKTKEKLAIGFDPDNDTVQLVKARVAARLGKEVTFKSMLI